MNEDTQENIPPIPDAIEDQIRSLDGVTASTTIESFTPSSTSSSTWYSVGGLLNQIDNTATISTYRPLTYTDLEQAVGRLEIPDYEVITPRGRRLSPLIWEGAGGYSTPLTNARWYQASPTLSEPELVTPSYGFITNCKIIKNDKKA